MIRRSRQVSYPEVSSGSSPEIPVLSFLFTAGWCGSRGSFLVSGSFSLSRLAGVPSSLALSWVRFSCLVVVILGWFQSLACSSFEKQLLCWPFLDGSCVRLRRMVRILWLTISGSLLLVIARFDGMVLVGSLVLLGFVDSCSPSLRWSLLLLSRRQIVVVFDNAASGRFASLFVICFRLAGYEV
ncbi:hypothetical protein ISN44_As13g010110 [Arabidopsis suecica]|uniref:Transmembrane protein n=1 Tax=Arabidopsis suecica TaxID=45249 RepID=A0A8T1XQT9_ARASU|nr:hypothetical protein ISN44_As13g010110 [Arabidopsis suecica]